MTRAPRHYIEPAVMAVILALMWWFLLVARHTPWPWGAIIDIDSPPVLTGLIAAGSGWGWHWWTGPWVQSTLAPFWRPAASQIWLVEYRLWGSDFESWRWVNYALHLALMLAVWGFVARLTRSRFAGFFMALTMTLVSEGLRWAVGWFPLQTSILSDLGMVLAMWAFLAYVEGGRRRSLCLSLVAFFLAVTCREVAFITPALVACVAWARRKPLRIVGPFLALGGALWAWRAAALRGVPTPAPFDLFRWSWPAGDHLRAMRTLGGPIGDGLAAIVGDGHDGTALWPAVFGIILGLALVFAASRPRYLVPALAAAWVSGIALAQALCGDFYIGIYPADLMGPAMRTAILVAGTVLVIREGNGRLALAAYAIMVIFYLPVAGREQEYQRYELLVTHALLFGVGVATLRHVFDRTHPRTARVVSWLLVFWLAVSALLMAYRPAWWSIETLLSNSIGPLVVLWLVYGAVAQGVAPSAPTLAREA